MSVIPLLSKEPTLHNEIWKKFDIDPRYHISNYGRVKGLKDNYISQHIKADVYYVRINSKTYQTKKIVMKLFGSEDPKYIEKYQISFHFIYDF